MTGPRNDGPQHVPPLRAPVNVRTVGARTDGGQVTAWLAADTGRVGINVAHATGVSVEISVRDAERLRDHLSDLLEQAGRER